MKRQTKLDSVEQQQAQQTGTEQHQQNATAVEFATAEELLRYDAARTPVPASIARRLQQSAAGLPRSKPAWWKRWWGGQQP
jgi:hypothetical protein